MSQVKAHKEHKLWDRFWTRFWSLRDAHGLAGENAYPEEHDRPGWRSDHD